VLHGLTPEAKALGSIREADAQQRDARFFDELYREAGP